MIDRIAERKKNAVSNSATIRSQVRERYVPRFKYSEAHATSLSILPKDWKLLLSQEL